MAKPEPKVVVAPEYRRPFEPTFRVPADSEERKTDPEKVDDAVEKSPPVKPITVEVELYPGLMVNGYEYELVAVRAPLTRERPEPVRSLNDSPLTMRLVVLAVTKEEYAVKEE